MTPTPLEQLGMPLFYKVANALERGFAPPLNRHGQSVRTWARSLTGMQKEAVVTSAATGTSWRLASDEGWYLNGADIGPSPLTFLTTGMVASYMNEIMALAQLRGIKLSGLKLVLDNHYTMQGSFRSGTMVASALAPELEVAVEADCEDQVLVSLIYEAVVASPLNGLTRGGLTSLFTLTSNGHALDTVRAAPLAGDRLPDPGECRAGLERAEGETVSQPVITKLADAPRPESAVGTTSSSLQERQNRGVHLRGTCTLRPDGVKEIRQETLVPIASTWRFLSDEGDAYGGSGRAPDAASYVSAGIAFCFMTQFGRFAKVQKKRLFALRAVQDTHFSAGGASGGTGKAGGADPVETHVYLDTDEDDTFARTILDTAERTCYLHAFCRTDLKAKVRLARDQDGGRARRARYLR